MGFGYLLIGICIGILFMFFLDNKSQKLLEKEFKDTIDIYKKIISSLKSEVSYYKDVVKQLNKEIELIKNDPKGFIKTRRGY
jgi:uncharacterized membrane-anchored protein YhcB (DUF1043 family)